MNRALTLGVAVLWPLLTAGSCATGRAPEPIIVTKEVAMPVAVSCVPQSVGPAPSYPDTDEALRTAASDRFLQLVLAGRDLRTKRQAVTEPTIEGCRSTAR